MKEILLSFLFIIFSLFAYGQTDTEFWFAAPEVSQTPPDDLDRPILLRITAYTSPAIVTVTQPAGTGSAMPPQVVSVAANSTVSVDLTTWLDSIECKPADRVLNYGLKITATAPVSVYYEAAALNNPEAFILKGRTALGNDFWIPSQNFVRNNTGTFPQALSSFDIVATENNTTVTITPTNAIQGHVAGSTFSVVLNTGQTYSATAAGNAAASHLQGSRVTSDKPIAITVKDDLLNETTLYLDNCGDLGGDQIVPSSVVGSEYIAIPGLLYGPGDQLFITATQNGTTIRQNGGPVLATINAGGTYRLPVGTTATYVQTSAPAYVWQLSGMGCEMGLGLLPKINCTGSSSVSFVRSTARSLFLNLMVKNGGQGDFLVNGISGVITAAAFSAVPGTGGQWYTAQVSLPLPSYPQGNAISVVNTSSLFHLGVLEGGFLGGTTYSYFSDFGSVKANATAGSSSVCPGAAIYLYADTVASATYSWAGPNGFISNQQNPVIPGVSNTASGVYTVTVDLPGCSSDLDTVSVQVKNLTVDLGADTAVCRDSIMLGSSGVYTLPTYLWNTGDVTASLKVTVSGDYWLEVQDEGCTVRDTIQVTLNSAFVNLGPDTFFCGDSLILTPSSAYAAPVYLWNTGTTTPSLKVTLPGTYWLNVNDDGCTGSDTVQVALHSAAVNLGPDFDICADSVMLHSSTAYTSPSYRWSTGAVSPSLKVTGSGTYWLEVTDNGCTASDTVHALLRTTPVNLGPDTFFCDGTGILQSSGTYSAPTYRWSTGAISPQITIAAPGVYWLEVMDNGCTGSDTIRVIFRSTPVNLGADISVCGDSVILTPSAAYAGPAVYRWSTGATSRQLKAMMSGSYWLEVSSNGCTGSDTIEVKLDMPFAVNLGPDISVCDKDTPVRLQVPRTPGVRYLWSTGATDTMVVAGNSGAYWLAVVSGACHASDTVQVSIVPTPKVYLGADSVICEQTPLKLSAFVPGASYLWSTGSTGNTIYVSATGWYWLKVNLNGCVTEADILITAKPAPAIDLGPDRNICPAGVITLDAAYPGISSYRWSTGDTTASVVINSAGLYHVAVTDYYGCTGYDTINLAQRYLPYVFADDTTVCEETPLLLAPRYMDADSLLWPDGSTGYTWRVSQGGSYIVKAANECGTVADTIFVRQIFCDIWLPNVFTPNGDGLNDVFRVLGNTGGIRGYSLSIFNRWGACIFVSSDKHQGWDGRYKGSEAPLGTYVYMLEYNVDGIPYRQKGNFHLLR